jgi:hypothetical protein
MYHSFLLHYFSVRLLRQISSLVSFGRALAL